MDEGARERVEDAYAEYLQQLRGAWRSPAQIAADTEHTDRAARDATGSNHGQNGKIPVTDRAPDIAKLAEAQRPQRCDDARNVLIPPHAAVALCI
jgi:hypothetical protein